MYVWYALAIFHLAFSCVGFAADKPATTRLIVYSPHGPEILSAAKDAFEKEHPEVTVEWVFDGAHALFTRLQRERSQPKADIWWGAPQATFMLATDLGLLSPYEPSWTKAAKAEFRDADHHWYGDLQSPLTIFYSMRSLGGNPMPPKDWDDLIEPVYKSRIAARDPLTSGTMRTLVLALVDRQLRAGKTLEQAMDWMKRLDDNIATYTPHSAHMFRLVGRGILPFGFWNAPEIKMRVADGFNIDTIFPASGMPVLVDGIALVRRQNIKPEAKKFYEMVTSIPFAEKLTRPPFNRIHVRDDLSEAAKPAYLKHSDFKIMPVDWRRIATQGEAWMSHLTSQVFDGRKLLQDGSE